MALEDKAKAAKKMIEAQEALGNVTGDPKDQLKSKKS